MSDLMCAQNKSYEQRIMRQREAYNCTADADATAVTIASPLDPTLFVPVSKLVSNLSKLKPRALG
eukprot:3045441-Karenia_brevis.AAC.1